MIYVVSLGGSIVAPDKVDTDFLASFVKLVDKLLCQDAAVRKNADNKFIFVVGGGAPARLYQNAMKETCDKAGAGGGNEASSSNAASVANAGGSYSCRADWIGIMATRLNAELVRSVFIKHCEDAVVLNPTKDGKFKGRILVAAGWKPGFSSDNDAVLLAKRFKSKTVINLSNIEKVYTADPKLDPNAKPIDSISWKDFRAMVGSEWKPGTNLPFDPVASANADKWGIRVICAAGKDLSNFEKIINGESFIGTVIGN